MFAIDLLKGQGLPQQVDFRTKLLRAAGVVLPLAALAVLAGAWRYDRSQLAAYESTLKENEAVVERHRDAVEAYERGQAHVEELGKQFGQVAEAMRCRVQATELFNEFVRQLPGEIFMHEIKLDRSVSKEKFQTEDSKVKQRTVLRRTVTLTLCDFKTPNGDRLIQDYIAGLNASPLAGSVFKDVKLAARQQGEADNRDVTYYYIECMLQEHSL